MFNLKIKKHHSGSCGVGGSSCEASIFVTLTVKIKHHLKEEYLNSIRELMPKIKSFEGCCSIYFCEHQEGLGEFEFFSKWKSREHYDKYVKWRSDENIVEDFEGKYFESEPVWRFLDLKSDI